MGMPRTTIDACVHLFSYGVIKGPDVVPYLRAYAAMAKHCLRCCKTRFVRMHASSQIDWQSSASNLLLAEPLELLYPGISTRIEPKHARRDTEFSLRGFAALRIGAKVYIHTLDPQLISK